MSTSELEAKVVDLTTATTELLNTVNTSKATLDASVTAAETAETNAETAETAAAASATSAATSAAEIGNYTSMTSLERALPTKAEFEALQNERKSQRAGSGFDEFGKNISTETNFENINEGMSSGGILSPSSLYIGRQDSTSNGVSVTNYPIANMNGMHLKVDGVFDNTTAWNNKITLPTAPTVTHADSSNSGMVLNGRDFTDTSSWTATSSALSVSNGELIITATVNGFANAYQDITTEVGVEYTFEFERRAGDVGIVCYIREDSANGAVIETIGTYSGTTNKRTKITFTATSTTMSIYLRAVSTTIGQYAILKNIMVCPSHEISRQDLVFLETWHENVADLDFVYPLGNTQYLRSTDDDGLAIVAGAFTGKETYSLFGNWQSDNALVGKGMVWSTMSDADKITFVSNPENNCYIDGTTIVQVRYRVRVVQGLGNTWNNVDPQEDSSPWYMGYSDGSTHTIEAKGKLTSIDKDLDTYGSANSFVTKPQTTYHNGENGIGMTSTDGIARSHTGRTFMLPIALVHRRNQGATHVKFNPNGTKKFLNKDGTTPAYWYNTDQQITCIADCFDV